MRDSQNLVTISTMRLINTSTLTLTEHPDSKLPKYAILSHRWLDSNDEVTFEDLKQGRDVTHKAGYAKLKNFCAVANSKGYEFAWCDTCCIDKASAVELGSAIRSMYRWYQNAEICIAYLHDVNEGGAAFKDAVWFRRGWTLQELIAPDYLEFFDREWRSIGTKKDNAEILSWRTRIPISVLKDNSTLFSCSIAQRMSWAADRETERVEDRAYSLLGLFNVSLEMIYGEQEKAFIRLQETIIQDSADQSILAWAMDSNKAAGEASGMFATSPSAFHRCGDVTRGSESKAFLKTNLGLSISFAALPYDIDTCLTFLNCFSTSSPTAIYAILLAKLKSSGQWARVSDNGESVFVRERSVVDQL